MKKVLDGVIAEVLDSFEPGTILVENCLWCLTEFRDAILAATVESLPSESEPE
jgi:hypothetical protein